MSARCICFLVQSKSIGFTGKFGAKWYISQRGYIKVVINLAPNSDLYFKIIIKVQYNILSLNILIQTGSIYRYEQKKTY